MPDPTREAIYPYDENHPTDHGELSGFAGAPLADVVDARAESEDERE